MRFKANLFLLGTALLLIALPGSSQGRIGKARAEGFSLSKSYHSIEGRSEEWTLRLYPNGQLTWTGNHTGEFSEQCSARAGRFEQKLERKKAETLLKLADQVASRESGKKSAEPVNPHDHLPHYNVVFENGKRVVAADVRDRSAKDFKALTAEAERLRSWLFEFKTSPARALELSTRKKGAHLVATLKNIGDLGVTVLLPVNASDAFSLRKGSQARSIAYATTPQSNEVSLGAGEQIEALLTIPKGVALKEGWLLNYDSADLLHHASSGAKTTDVSLCSRISEGEGKK